MMLGQLAAQRALGVAERRRLGRMAKDLLDTGRARYLQAHGYRAWVEGPFVPASVTPENRLLRAQLPELPVAASQCA
ncbi:hypothetical protein T492DRAFT_1037112 [Pavlovales sp. CCMP2436]|nr:hypothetical protein T492DRAFT_1037112 [Pavlovales sp. CCMP2436]